MNSSLEKIVFLCEPHAFSAAFHLSKASFEVNLLASSYAQAAL